MIDRTSERYFIELLPQEFSSLSLQPLVLRGFHAPTHAGRWGTKAPNPCGCKVLKGHCLGSWIRFSEIVTFYPPNQTLHFHNSWPPYSSQLAFTKIVISTPFDRGSWEEDFRIHLLRLGIRDEFQHGTAHLVEVGRQLLLFASADGKPRRYKTTGNHFNNQKQPPNPRRLVQKNERWCKTPTPKRKFIQKQNTTKPPENKNTKTHNNIQSSKTHFFTMAFNAPMAAPKASSSSSAKAEGSSAGKAMGSAGTTSKPWNMANTWANRKETEITYLKQSNKLWIIFFVPWVSLYDFF